MAESVVSFVLRKLGDAFVKEVLHLYGVSGQVEKVSRELSWIQAFLKDADRKHLDKRQEHWVKEVRDLAYAIEDVIDTFLLTVPEKKPGKWEAVRRLFLKTKKLPAVHILGNEINTIEARIQEIEASRVRYGISNLGEGVEGEIEQPAKRIVPLDADEAGLVGFEEDQEKIISLLLDETNKRRSVISIVGTGGLGKTTLARKVYRSVKEKFNIRIWVTVSQKFQTIDILRKIADQLQMEPPKDLSEHQVTKLYRSLAKSSYLLVLDDVWTKNFWNQIEGLLPEENNGSRILITTRFVKVAQVANPTSVPYKLQFLSEDQSLELLMKKALPNRDANDGYPNDLYSIGRELAKRCGGLPLALVVLGGLLSTKLANNNTWSKMMQNMDWGTEGKQCIAVIGTSYDDLPLALKSCFLYFAAFPEDYEIDATSVLRMWIAEGFISQQNNKTLEDTAESFLEDLVQRSMIQVSERHPDGSITRCRIHDLLHELAIQKAKEETFVMACSKIDDVRNCSQTRRLAINDNSWTSIEGRRFRHQARCQLEEKYAESLASITPNLRSLLCCTMLMPRVSQLMHLKVLSNLQKLQEYEIGGSYTAGKVGRWSQLRYVQLYVGSYNDNFDKFISGLRFLQTLELHGGSIASGLPDCVWHVKTLRHVILSNSDFGTIPGPPPSVDLRNLQTLSGVQCRESWETGLPNLPNVKLLRISSFNQLQWDITASLLGTLKYLTSLQIEGDDVPLNIIDMRNFPFYRSLQNLCLRDYANYARLRNHHKTIALDVGMFPIYLTTLRLEHIYFTEDPIPVLEKLENLRSLHREVF